MVSLGFWHNLGVNENNYNQIGVKQMTIEFDEGERTWARNNDQSERDSDMSYEIDRIEIIKIVNVEMQNPNGWAMSAILEKIEGLGYVTDFARLYILNHCDYHKDENGNEVKRESI